MRHKITAGLGGLSPAAAAAVMSKPAVTVVPEVNLPQSTVARQQDADEEQSSTLDIELLKEFELIGADSKNDEVNNETVKEETAVADDLLDPEPRARCNTWPRLQYAAATSVVNGGSPVMQVCTIVCTCSTYVLRR